MFNGPVDVGLATKNCVLLIDAGVSKEDDDDVCARLLVVVVIVGLFVLLNNFEIRNDGFEDDDDDVEDEEEEEEEEEEEDDEEVDDDDDIEHDDELEPSEDEAGGVGRFIPTGCCWLLILFACVLLVIVTAPTDVLGSDDELLGGRNFEIACDDGVVVIVAVFADTAVC